MTGALHNLQRTVGIAADPHIPGSTASPAVADGPLDASVGVGRAVVGLPSASVCPARSFEGEAADGSSSGTGRIVVGLNICFEGEGANELFGLVLSDVIDALPKRARGLDRVAVTTLARVDGGGCA